MNETVGDRLKWAIRQWGPRPRGRPGEPGSIRAFHRLLKEKVPSGEGASYQMLHRYLPTDAGEPAETVPPESFLRVAAEVLSDEGRRVRLKWIAFGEGEPTEERERARDATDAVAEEAVRRDRALRFKQEVLAALAPMPDPDEDAVLTEDAMDAWMLGANAPGVPVWVAPLSEVQRRSGMEPATIGELLAAPLSTAEIRPASMGADALTTYILSMVPALLALAPERARQHEEN